MSQLAMQSFPGRRNCKCKCPEAGGCLLMFLEIQDQCSWNGMGGEDGRRKERNERSNKEARLYRALQTSEWDGKSLKGLEADIMIWGLRERSMWRDAVLRMDGLKESKGKQSKQFRIFSMMPRKRWWWLSPGC